MLHRSLAAHLAVLEVRHRSLADFKVGPAGVDLRLVEGRDQHSFLLTVHIRIRGRCLGRLLRLLLLRRDACAGQPAAQVPDDSNGG